MKFKATIKRRFRKPINVLVLGEDMMYALYNVVRKYPKHKVIKMSYYS